MHRHRQRHWRRPVLSTLTALLLLPAGVIVLTAPAQAAVTDIRINEVESNGGTPGDWVELINIGSTTTDLGGIKFKDNDDTHAFYTIPAGTTLAPGAYLTLEEAQFGFGLGAADSARLFAADGTTVVDSYSWTAHAAGTYSRCSNGVGAFVDGASTKAATNSCAPVSPTVVKINEIESSGGTPGDWVELTNTGASTVDLSGLKVKDDDDTHVYTIPAFTTLASGGYYVIEEAALGFGLGQPDAVRLLGGDGTTVIDSYTWTTHATTTYGRCPDGTGAFATTQLVTKGAKNNCAGDIVAAPWPGGAAVKTVDEAGLATSNMSGLAYEGTGSTTPGTLWAVRNGPETLFKLVKSGGSWVPAAGDWAAGKQLRYPAGTGQPDSEGVTFTDAGSAGGAFVATERDNADNTVSRPAILRFAPGAAGTSLTATNDWNLTADLPAVGPNLGLEGIAWVPDSYLTAKGFRTSGGTVYDPAGYANHGTGLFFVGVEANGMIYAYALDLTSNAYTRVASFSSGFPSVMEVHFEQETQKLWVVCDDTCQGRSARFDVDISVGATQGRLVPVEYYERPTGMPNLNNEGFTTTPRSECVAGVKPVFWTDDGDTGGNSLREGTLSCTNRTDPTITASVSAARGRSAAGWFNTPVTVTFTCTAPGSTLVGGCPAPVTLSATAADQSVTRSVRDVDGGTASVTVSDLDIDTEAPPVSIVDVRAGKTYTKKQRPRCLSLDVVSFLDICTVTQVRVGKKYVVTATARDLAGNVSTATLTYKVKKRKHKG